MCIHLQMHDNIYNCNEYNFKILQILLKSFEMFTTSIQLYGKYLVSTPKH